MTNEEAIKLAHSRILHPGYKPEDYFSFGTDYCVRIAKLIVNEAKHIINQEKVKEQLKGSKYEGFYDFYIR